MNLKTILNMVQPKETPIIQIVQHLEPAALKELLTHANLVGKVYVFPEDLTVDKLNKKLSK